MRLGHGSELVPEGIEARALHPRRHHGDPVTRTEVRGAVPKVGRAHVVQGPSFRIWPKMVIWQVRQRQLSEYFNGR